MEALLLDKAEAVQKVWHKSAMPSLLLADVL